ncbi:hypothetical protein ACHAWF_008731 [Thalassiosira exigua]
MTEGVRRRRRSQGRQRGEGPASAGGDDRAVDDDRENDSDSYDNDKGPRRDRGSDDGDGGGGGGGGGGEEPLRLPHSTHALLFLDPARSLPFAVASGVAGASFACLVLAAWHNARSGTVPVNVGWAVRVAQYLGVGIALLMEEEIPNSLYLLRMFPRDVFKRSLPGKSYRAFVASNVLRIIVGYCFLVNVFLVLVQASGVVEIFYEVLALQFVQQLDDIAFSLSKIEILGRDMFRACTAGCFQEEFKKKRFRRGSQLGVRSSRLAMFLKALYFLNFGALLAGMAIVSMRQIGGYYQCDSITVDFGGDVWEEAIVNMPREQYDRWVSLYPYFRDAVTPDRYEEWTLVFSYFNGHYERDGSYAGRPVYRERRKSDRTPYGQGLDHAFVVPAVIKYCPGISSWVFTHDHIQKSKEEDERGCNWLLRSEETTEYDLLSVDRKWKIWYGFIGETDLSYSCNRCSDALDCNMNGRCIDGECKCNEQDDAHYLGTHCEVKLKNSCRTIIGEDPASTFAVLYWSPGEGIASVLNQKYSRPMYHYIRDPTVEQILGNTEEDYVFDIVYSGDRWFGQSFHLKALNRTWDTNGLSSWEYHAFWGRGYDRLLTQHVSAQTKKHTPPPGWPWRRRAISTRTKRTLLTYALILVSATCHIRNNLHGRRVGHNNHSSATGRSGSETGSRDRLYCLVPSIWTPKFIPTYRAIKSTWGKRCDFLRFTVDAVVGDEEVGYYNLTVPSEASAAREANLFPPDDVAVLHDMNYSWHICFEYKGQHKLIKKSKPPPCGNTWEKTYRSFLWVGNHEGDVAEWYAKVDTDTYFFPENALRFVERKGWSPDEPRNFGHTLTNAKQVSMPKLFNAGPAYFFSRATIPLITGMFSTFDVDDSDRGATQCFAREGRGEDTTMARCIYWWWKDGVFPEIPPEGTLDDEGNELISLFPIDAVLHKGRDALNISEGWDWYWRNKEEKHPVTGKEMHVCCGVHPIAFHGYKNSRWFFKLEHELYGETESLKDADADNWRRKLSWNNTHEVGAYFEKVREAMRKDVMQ